MEVDLKLVVEPRKGKRQNVMLQRGEEVLFADLMDPASSKQRADFIKAAQKKLPALQDREAELETQLLSLAKAPAPSSIMSPQELEICRIVRPEQFFATELSCVSVSVVMLADGKPASRWMQYLRWANGRRECRDLSPCIELSDGKKLWIHPTPGEPSMNTVPGWSSPARRAWLQGSTAPNPAQLFKEICERIAYFLDFPPDLAVGTTATLALWSMLTYVYQAWDAVPYLYVGGPMGSGKSRLFEILHRLSFRSLQSSNLTAPALFRTLHDRGGVLLYDEAERLRQSSDPSVGETLSMLLAGYKRGGQATRLEAVGDSFRPVAFDVYGPKALACIAGLPPTLASRCIQVMMFRASPNSTKPQHRIDAESDGWQRLRDGLHAMVLDHGPKFLELARHANVCPPGINGRAYELWQPLLALAWWIESNGAAGLLSMMQKHALDSIDAGSDDQIPDADETLLEILTGAIQANEWVSPGDLLARAQERDQSTFGKANGSGPKWHASTVSRRLKAYGIPTPKKSNGKRLYRHVTLAMLLRVQRNYGIDLGIPELPPQESTLSDPIAPKLRQVVDNCRVSQGR